MLTLTIDMPSSATHLRRDRRSDRSNDFSRLGPLELLASLLLCPALSGYPHRQPKFWAQSQKSCESGLYARTQQVCSNSAKNGVSPSKR
jgi:hypothetical protein